MKGKRGNLRVMAAMSGGVDSSVAAALLVEQGYEVIGGTMKLMDSDESLSDKSCCNWDAARGAKLVADQLGIAHYTIDAREAFDRTVIDPFGRQYARGRTPNPCIQCNRFLKFGFLLQKARALGCDMIATGHYARIHDGKLKRGLDPAKDQSYFLYVVYGCDADRIIFPVGELTKNRVRQIAAERGLPTASRKESQDICFIPDGDTPGFLEGRLGAKPGPIVDTAGNVLGRHQGIYRYTVGQRKGLGALGKRMFVQRIDPDSLTIVVAENHELFTDTVRVEHFLTAGSPVSVGERYLAQIRYRSQPTPVRIDAVEHDRIRLEFEEPVRAPAAGQAAVLYDEELVVGGGTIVNAPHT